jgi:hypothetical protein
MNRSMLISIVLLAALAIAVPSATAGTARSSADTSPAWVSASPDPAPAGSRVELTGCGFDVKPAQIRIHHSAGYSETYGVGMWSTGCFSGTFDTQEAGTYTIEVYQEQRNTRKSMVLKASTTLSVG